MRLALWLGLIEYCWFRVLFCHYNMQCHSETATQNEPNFEQNTTLLRVLSITYYSKHTLSLKCTMVFCVFMSLFIICCKLVHCVIARKITQRLALRLWSIEYCWFHVLFVTTTCIVIHRQQDRMNQTFDRPKVTGGNMLLHWYVSRGRHHRMALV